MGIGRSLSRGGNFLLGHWEELKDGVQSSSLGSGRSLSRGGDFLLGHWEELKEGSRALLRALGGA